MPASQASCRLTLLGARGAGKSALLLAALDPRAFSGRGEAGRFPPPGAAAAWELRLEPSPGVDLLLRERRTDDEATPAPPGPHAVLHVVRWEKHHLDGPLGYVRAQLDAEPEQVTGLALTAAELVLPEEDPAWTAAPGWWRKRPELAAHEELLDALGGAIWPTSACGYDEATGLPAVLLDEQGRYRPFRARPRAVLRPLRELCEELHRP